MVVSLNTLLLLSLLFLLLSLGNGEDPVDHEIVLVEDISDSDEDIAKSYGQSYTDETKEPAASKPRKSRSSSSSNRKPTQQQDGPPTTKSVNDGIARLEKELNALSIATADYSISLHDAEHVNSMSKLRNEAFSTASKTWSEASRGANTVSQETFLPLLDRVTDLQKQVHKYKNVIQNQVNLHQALMRKTQDLFPYASKKGTKALRSYVNQRVKKGLASSVENVREMQKLQQTVRGQLWTGFTAADVNLIAVYMALPFIAYTALHWTALGFRKVKSRSLHVDVIVANLCSFLAYSGAMMPVAGYCTKTNFLCQFLILALVSIAVAFVKFKCDKFAKFAIMAVFSKNKRNY